MNDDLDEEIIGAESDFDEFAQKANLGDTVRQSPVAKIGIVIVAIVVIVGAVLMFGQEAIEDQQSVIPQGSDVTSVPGTDEQVSPAYIDAVEQQNEADLERAIVQGESSIPVPIKTTETRLEVPEVEEQSEDPLHRWRLLQEERVEREMKVREVETEPVTVLNAEQQSEAINDLSSAMEEQMSSLLTATDETKTFNTVTLIDYKSEDEEGGIGGIGGGAGGGPGDFDDTAAFEEDTEEVVIIPAGKIVYGQMLLEANSDIPSVILAQMVSGPLKGWKLLGQFELLSDIEMLGVTFNTAVNEDGKQYTIDAVMLNPDDGLAAHATDVDHRYFRRIVLPAAAAFVEGFAEAIADSGATSVTVGAGGATTESEEESTDEQEVATGVTEAAQEIGTILDDLADVPIRVIIAAGTPIGIFFHENVVETEEGDI